MSFGTAIWNFTEYLCYLSIIIQTGITVWGCFKGQTTDSNAGMTALLSKGLDQIGKISQEFTKTSTGKSKPASRP